MSCGAFDRFAEAVRTPTRLPVDLEQFINLGDDRNVRRVWVRGRECVRKDSHE
jgi:cytosine/adenosine deaminase-related metal-dependent hydrolase